VTASHLPVPSGAPVAPIVDYEPEPYGVVAPGVAAGPCPTPTPAALHRPPRRLLRPVGRSAVESAPPAAAVKFADATLRRVLEVIDRRRPLAQLRGSLTPAVLDIVYALSAQAAADKSAVLRRVRLRTIAIDGQRAGAEPTAAEVFATYSRGERVRAIAGRIEANEGRWRIVALQVG
jgi:uncharacterized protein DUF6459